MYDAPILCPPTTVEEAWIDYNGHMNMAFYVLAFDQCLDHVYEHLEIGEQYMRDHNGSCFTREVQVNYVRELTLGDPIHVEFQLLDWDSKRLHFFETMRHGTRGYIAATCEQLALHVDMTNRRTTPFSDATQVRIAEMMSAHAHLTKPEQVGQSIGIRRR